MTDDVAVTVRYHTQSVSGQHMTDADMDQCVLEDIGQLQCQYRNYTDTRYSVYVDVVRMSVNSCPKVSSKMEQPLNLPMAGTCTADGDDQHCHLTVTLYPQVMNILIV